MLSGLRLLTQPVTTIGSINSNLSCNPHSISGLARQELRQETFYVLYGIKLISGGISLTILKFLLITIRLNARFAWLSQNVKSVAAPVEWSDFNTLPIYWRWCRLVVVKASLLLIFLYKHYWLILIIIYLPHLYFLNIRPESLHCPF